jgi:hypothetical protein
VGVTALAPARYGSRNSDVFDRIAPYFCIFREYTIVSVSNYYQSSSFVAVLSIGLPHQMAIPPRVITTIASAECDLRLLPLPHTGKDSAICQSTEGVS